MNFSSAEIEALRLAGWLKALPQELGRFNTHMLSPAGIAALLELRLLHRTGNGRYLRPTASGWDFLSFIGFDYPKDSRYVTDPRKLSRRDEAAKILFTCYRAGLGVFADRPEYLASPGVYLSAAAARRNPLYQGNRVWAGCRLAGIVRLRDTAYLAHFVNDGGMYFTTEMELLHKLASGRCPATACFYFADSYEDAASTVLHGTPASGQGRTNGLVPFHEACRRTDLPLHLAECSNTGALQLLLMNTPKYRDKAVRLLLGRDFHPPLPGLPDTDAVWNGIPLLIAADMDVKRIGRACKTVRLHGCAPPILVALREQLPALHLLFEPAGVTEFYELFREPLMDGLNLSLYEPSAEQYRTKEGGLVSATDIPPRRKAGRPPRQEMEPPLG